MADNTVNTLPPPPQNPNLPQPHYPSLPPPPLLHSQTPNPQQQQQQQQQRNSQLDPLDKTHDPDSLLAPPPWVDPTSSSSAAGVHEACDPAVPCDQTAYYQDPIVANSLKNWALDVLRYYGSNPNDARKSDPGVPYDQSAYYQDPNVAKSFKNWALDVLRCYRSNPNVAGVTRNSTRKNSAKKTKVAQSVRCEICSVECNTKEVLDVHKMGKKHKKNEDKLKEPTAPHPPATSGVSVNPVIGPQENHTSSVQKNKKEGGQTRRGFGDEEEENYVEGAASDAVRVCTICNLVCNSELVFAYHNVGKKHAAMMIKQSVSGTGVATAT